MADEDRFSRTSLTRALRRIAPAAACVLVGAVMLAWTWLAWPDLLIDFGRELYLAWRLSEGERLYADIAHFNGPLSPYLNSVWFRAFGTGIRTLVIANLAILALATALLYALLRAASDRVSATVACLVFLAVFAFSHFTVVGNYNYVTPYSHEMTHGLVLSLASIGCVVVYARRRRPFWLVGTGLALGLVFLTKVEVFVAAAVGVSIGLILTLHAERGALRAKAGRLLVFIGSALVPPLVAWLLLAMVMPAGEAVAGVLRPYTAPLEADALSLPFYRTIMGTDHIGANLGRMLVQFGWGLALFGPVALLALFVRRPSPRAHLAAGVAFALATILPALAWNTLDAGRALPLIVLALLVVLLIGDRRRSSPDEPDPGHISRITLLVFAGALLLKILLNAGVYHYGFVLAMPATLLLVVALVGWIPDRIQRLGGQGIIFRTAALGFLLAAVAAVLGVARVQIASKNFWFGQGADLLRVDEIRGRMVARLLEEIDRRLASDQTLATLPEGAMVNYLARRPNPTAYVGFMPPELAIFGERHILAAFREEPPDAVVLIHRTNAEYGVSHFGEGYGEELSEWIDAEYCPVFTLDESSALQDSGLGLELRKRNEASVQCSKAEGAQATTDRQNAALSGGLTQTLATRSW